MSVPNLRCDETLPLYLPPVEPIGDSELVRAMWIGPPVPTPSLFELFCEDDDADERAAVVSPSERIVLINDNSQSIGKDDVSSSDRRPQTPPIREAVDSISPVFKEKRGGKKRELARPVDDEQACTALPTRKRTRLSTRTLVSSK